MRIVKAERQASSMQTILVIDDSPLVLALVDDSLRTRFHVRATTSGDAALAMLERDHTIDLILLDVLMPGMDGFETCRRIKADARWRDIPIIFLTALSSDGDEVKGLHLGAVDYITKPVVPVTLRARVMTHMELRRVRRELEQTNARLLAEREIIESMTLRMRADSDFDTRLLHCLLKPMERNSGDIGLAAFCPDGRQMVLVGDFAGHGLVAAIGGSSAKQTFYTACAHNASLEAVVAALNTWLHGALLEGQFMAATLAEVSPARDCVRLWGGAMHEALRIDDHGQVETIPLHGFPLGLLPEIGMEDEVVCLPAKPGDRVLLFSDGCIEAVNEEREMYGIARLSGRYGSLWHSETVLQALLADIEKFVGTQPQRDDFVLLEIRL